MLKGFRDFLLRGNVVDLAVAVIVYFVVIIPMDKALEQFNRQDEASEIAATLTKDQELLIEVRDALARR